jgi:hypothetical protein
LCILPALAICQTTPFEASGGKESATYEQCIKYYHQLGKASAKLSIKQMGMSDARYPYDVVMFSNDGKADPAVWHAQHKTVILIVNGIHPGEPDGN